MKERMLTVKVPIKGTESFIIQTDTAPQVAAMEENKLYLYDGKYYRRVKNERLDDVKDVEFPKIGQPLELFEFTYDATRMGTAPTITASAMWPYCLDAYWTQDCFVSFNGEKFFLRFIPTSSKDNEDARYKHEIAFVSERMVLEDIYFYDIVSPYFTDRPVSESSAFSFYGDIKAFADRLNASMAKSGLTKFIRRTDGSGTPTEAHIITYDEWRQCPLGLMPQYESQYGSAQGDYQRYLNNNVWETHSVEHIVDGHEVSVEEYEIKGYQVVLGLDSNGNTVTSEEKLLTFENNTIHEALQKIKDEFGMQYYFTTDENGNKKIVIGDCEHDFGEDNAFAYGADNALLSIEKANTTEKIVTRISGVGSSENIPWYYPNPTPDGWIKATYKRDSSVHDLWIESVPEDNEKYEKFLKNRLGVNFVYGQLTGLAYMGTDAPYQSDIYEALDRNKPVTLVEEYGLIFKVKNDNSAVLIRDIRCTSNIVQSLEWAIKKITKHGGWSDETDAGHGPQYYTPEYTTLEDAYNVSGELVSEYSYAYSNRTELLNEGEYVLNMKVTLSELPEGSEVRRYVLLFDRTLFSLYDIDDGYISPLLVNNRDINIEDYHVKKVEEKKLVWTYKDEEIPSYGSQYGEYIGSNEETISACCVYILTPYIIPGVAAGTAWRKETNDDSARDVTLKFNGSEMTISEITDSHKTTRTEFYSSSLEGTVKVYNHAWVYETNNKEVNLENYGITLNIPNSVEVKNKLFDKIVFKRVKYITPQKNLMPEIFIMSNGERRFYEAKQYRYPETREEADADYTATPDTAAGETSEKVPQGGTLDSTKHGLHNTLYRSDNEGYYIFENLCLPNLPKEHIENFEDIKPTIKEMRNSNNQRIDVIEEFAYDEYDDDSIWENGGEQGQYKHPHFFAKLRPLGFNLFDLALTEDMVISMVTGNCGACNFKIKVTENTKKNPVQIWEKTVYEKIARNAEEYDEEDEAGNKYKIYANQGDLQRYRNMPTLYSKRGMEFEVYDVPMAWAINDTNGGFNTYMINTLSGDEVTAGSVGTLNASGWRHIEGDVVTSGKIHDAQQDTTANYVWVALEKDLETYGTPMPSANVVYANAGYAIYTRPKSYNDTEDADGNKHEDKADEFVFLNILLPQAYLRYAEHQLSRALVKCMFEKNAQKYNFSINFSRIFLAQNEANIESQLNENSVLYVTYADGMTKYKQYVSHYSYKMSKGSVLPEISVDMNEELSAYRSSKEQAKVEEQKRRREWMSEVVDMQNKQTQKMRDSFLPKHQDVFAAGNINSGANSESMSSLKEVQVRLEKVVQAIGADMSAQTTDIRTNYFIKDAFDMSEDGLSIDGHNVIKMEGTKRFKIGETEVAPAFVDTTARTVASYESKYEVLTSAPDDWAQSWGKYYQKVDDTYVKLDTLTEAPEFATGTYYKLNLDFAKGTITPWEVFAEEATKYQFTLSGKIHEKNGSDIQLASTAQLTQTNDNINITIGNLNNQTQILAKTLQDRFLQNGSTFKDNDGNYKFSYVDGGITKDEFFWYKLDRDTGDIAPQTYDSSDTGDHSVPIIPYFPDNTTTTL